MSSLKKRRIRPSGTTLFLPESELKRLHAHARAGHPHEVVGILAGRSGRVTRVVPLENDDTERPERRYHVDGLRLMRAEAALAAEGLEVLGYYHSHPDHPAMYSDTDRDLALPRMSYVIVSVQGGEDGARVVDTRSWRLREDRSEMDSEAIVIE